ncbi:MAG: chorismate synthase [Clostridia bacterium]|nr:chorismate synthase [Clostridia bacterium]
MSNSIGTVYRFTVWGQSHSPAIGVTVEGIPAGTQIDTALLQEFLDRRKPGGDPLTTARKEEDEPEFIAGVIRDDAGGSRILTACGAPVTAVIRNLDARSGDYEGSRYIPRPGHADLAAMAKYGDARDHAGGGQFSGRMTAPLCIAGGIALQLLERLGIVIAARPVRIGGKTEPDRMRQAVEAAKAEGDSVGGIVECVIDGVPAGVGEPMFDGLENRIAQAVFGIPAVKGIEFGSGFAGAQLRGSENNDPFVLLPGQGTDITARVGTDTNNHGGSLGGLSSGMPIVFRAAFKPTPSIAKEQDSVDIRTGEKVRLSLKGRFDPCVALRAVPAVEAAAAAALYDLIRLREA